MRTTLYKVTKCDAHLQLHKNIDHQNMKNYPAWISAEVQARIKPPPIPLIKKDPLEANEYDVIKIKMRRNPSDAASKTYKLKIVTFEHGQPEEFLQIIKKSKRAVD